MEKIAGMSSKIVACWLEGRLFPPLKGEIMLGKPVPRACPEMLDMQSSALPQHVVCSSFSFLPMLGPLHFFAYNLCRFIKTLAWRLLPVQSLLQGLL
jgi:hypothetical protein